MMVIYLPAKFDWTQRFRVRVQKLKCSWTDNTDKKLNVGLNAVLGWPQGIRPTSKKHRHL